MDPPERQAHTILQLPNETLYQILSEIKWGAPQRQFELDDLNWYENLTQNTTEIKNIRLVCRAFADLAGHLLLPVVSVAVVQESSLQQFEEISRHPIFSRHVQAVRVSLCHYDERLAKDIRSFAKHLVRQSSGLPGIPARWGRKLPKKFQIAGMSREASEQWRHIFCDWRQGVFTTGQSATGMEQIKPHNWKDPSTFPACKASEILSREHTAYKACFERQKDIFSSRAALDRITQAMARMPGARRLIVDDTKLFHRGRSLEAYSDILNPPQHLRNAAAEDLHNQAQSAVPQIAVTSYFKEASNWAITGSLGRFLMELLFEIYESGLRLTAFRVHGIDVFNMPTAFRILDLSSALGVFKVFEVTSPQRNHRLIPSDEHYMLQEPLEEVAEDFWVLLKCVFRSGNLRRLNIDGFNDEGSWAMEEILFGLRAKSTQSDQIEVIRIRSGDISSNAVEELLAHMLDSGSLAQLHLKEVCFSGHFGLRDTVMVLGKFYPRLLENGTRAGPIDGPPIVLLDFSIGHRIPLEDSISSRKVADFIEGLTDVDPIGV